LIKTTFFNPKKKTQKEEIQEEIICEEKNLKEAGNEKDQRNNLLDQATLFFVYRNRNTRHKPR